MKKYFLAIIFVIAYATFLSIGLECLLNLLGLSMAIALDGGAVTKQYPRFIPFCIAVGLFALLVLGLLAFFNIKHSEKLGYTKRLWIFQLVSVFVLSIPATEIWRMIFELLHKVFSK